MEEKEFVPYNLALKLKELGFNEPCLSGYNDRREPTVTVHVQGRNVDTFNYYERQSQYFVLRPTFSQVFRWFEKNHTLKCWVEWGSEYLELANYQDSFGIKHFISEHGTKEEAEVACLEKLIKILETK